MPLRDHFRPPLHPRHRWEGFHAAWPTMMLLELFPTLPEGYFAEPRVHLGTAFEIDVGALEPFAPVSEPPHTGNGGLALATEAALTLEVELPDPSEYELLIFDEAEGRRLVAAVEIVSPANKDRDEHRATFVSKCLALLQRQVCVAIVDIVTVRRANLYLELLDHLDRSDPLLSPSSPATYAVSSRSRRGDGKWRLDLVRHELKLGQPLPTLPLWLNENLVVPLDLEASYEATCRALRIA
jgi:hypothetical protein